MDLYNIIINDPIFLTIAVILSIFIVFTAIKKMFKYLVVLIALCVCYIGYLSYIGENIPQTTDEFQEKISEDSKELLEDGKKWLDDKLQDANVLLKNDKK